MRYVRNRSELLSSGETDLRDKALRIAERAIAAANPAQVLRAMMRMDGTVLTIGDKRFDLAARRLFVIGAGKATFPIAEAIDDIVGKRIRDGVIGCKHGQQGTLEHIRVIHASHPLPDDGSMETARATVSLLADVKPNDVVLSCFTGGSSSLFVAPVEGISLQDKVEAFKVLLTCGANIEEINDVRKHLSVVKGGRLIKALPSGATVVNLTVSDVIGDALDYITDPSVADRSTFENAHRVLDKYALWDRLPRPVTTHLKRASRQDETVRGDELSHLRRHDVILVRTDAACVGAAAAAKDVGVKPLLLSTFFEGESSALGRNLMAIARQVQLDGQPVAPPCMLIGGGETIVTFDGAAGLGGPNQEFAVSAALEINGASGIVALGLDTDGTDGPTDVAGGIVDGSTVATAARIGVDLRDALARHDVTPALRSISHAILTGATGTNVNDLKLVLVEDAKR